MRIDDVKLMGWILRMIVTTTEDVYIRSRRPHEFLSDK